MIRIILSHHPFSREGFMNHSLKRQAFTLIELLVVIAIIAILIALLVPAVQKVREASARTQCINNLKQIGLALHGYHDTYKMLPSGYYPAGSGALTYTGWQLQLLPYLDQTPLYTSSYAYLQANPGGTDSSSFPAVGATLAVFICPSNTRPLVENYAGVNYELTSYMGVAGTSSANPLSADGVLYVSSQVPFAQITDGTSNTIAVGERPCTGDLQYGWGFAPYGTGSGDGDTVLGTRDTFVASNLGDSVSNVGLQAPLQPQTQGEIDGGHFWSFHPGGATFLFCDGTVHFLPYAANNILPALGTRAGAETFSPQW
jgi:prepilin-type N-terminal cleavage/methylation domain-containing protein/prepilin-type processing-associated H-X9-DG protein